MEPKKFKSQDENPIIESTLSQYNYYPILFENACNYLQALTSKGTKYQNLFFPIPKTSSKWTTNFFLGIQTTMGSQNYSLPQKEPWINLTDSDSFMIHRYLLAYIILVYICDLSCYTISIIIKKMLCLNMQYKEFIVFKVHIF